MDYKEKYKQALEKARAIHINEDEKRFDMEWLFPELVESEDERIKREILEYINSYADLKDEKIPTKWLEWLEKQGQVKESHISQHESKTCEENNEFLTNEDERIRKEILNVFKQLDESTTICGRNYDYAKWIAWLEKQGDTFTKKDIDDAYLKGISDAKNELERQSEQPTDKVESKFKVGDWV